MHPTLSHTYTLTHTSNSLDYRNHHFQILHLLHATSMLVRGVNSLDVCHNKVQNKFLTSWVIMSLQLTVQLISVVTDNDLKQTSLQLWFRRSKLESRFPAERKSSSGANSLSTHEVVLLMRCEQHVIDEEHF